MQIYAGTHYFFWKYNSFFPFPSFLPFLQRLLFHCALVTFTTNTALIFGPLFCTLLQNSRQNFFKSFSSSYSSSVMPKSCSMSLQKIQLLCLHSDIFSPLFPFPPSVMPFFPSCLDKLCGHTLNLSVWYEKKTNFVSKNISVM